MALVMALGACSTGSGSSDASGSPTTSESARSVPTSAAAATDSSANTDIDTSADSVTGSDAERSSSPTGSTIRVPASVDAVNEAVRPEGFTTVTARITSASGDVCEVCMWLADDSTERGRGLMGVTDLGEPDGMAFVWERPVDGRFYMLDTPTPLSIAWFAPGGNHLNQADMAPCITDDASTCERYGAAGTYDLAIEMIEGDLGGVGIGPGSSVELVDGSDSPTCLAGT